MNTTISVVIPTYNRRHVLPRAIDSVLNQSLAPAELIVVDDGSTDDTCGFLRDTYSEKVTLLSQQNSGVSAARNAGIQASTGNWIALLDSDDEWLPEKLQQQISTIENDTTCVLCHTDEIWIRNSIRVNQMNKHQKSGGDIFLQCLPLCAISPSSVMIKREIFESSGMFDESLPACEDYDLWLRICAIHKVHYLEKKLLIKYGGHDDQLSRKHWGMDRFRIKALHKLLNQVELTHDQRQCTIDMLERKAQILIKGAAKHGNQQLIDECSELLSQHNLSIPGTGLC